MEFNNIDIILNTNFTINTSDYTFINQYATNYKLRIAFVDPDFRVEKLFLVVNNGAMLPTKFIFISNQTMLVNNVETHFYEYVLTQYDTQKFVEELGFTVTGYNENSSLIGNVSFDVSMKKRTFSKITPLSLEDDSSLNSAVVKTNDLQEQILDLTVDYNTKLDTKVDKISGKELSTNDLTDELKVLYDAAETISHSHTNKEILDTYDQTNEDISQAIVDDHTHSNKTILDNIEESFLTEDKTHLYNTVLFTEQTLTEEQKGLVRSQLDVGENDFSGYFEDLSGKPTTLNGYGITDSVGLDNTQTITGLKTINNNFILNGNLGIGISNPVGVDDIANVIHLNSSGDNFPTIRLQRSDGIIKTNAIWDYFIDTAGGLRIRKGEGVVDPLIIERTSPAETLILKSNGNIQINGITNGTYSYTLPLSNGELALTSQIPSLTNYVTTNTTQNITTSKTFIPSGTDSLIINNILTNGYSRIKYSCDSADFTTGVGGSAVSIAALQNAYYIYDFVNSKAKLTITSTETKLLDNNVTIEKDLILSSSIKKDANTFTLPSSTGTLALTNQIPTVIDSLTSTSATDALSANQGRVLKSEILDSKEVWDGTVGTAFASGTGTEIDPYIISNGKELAYLASVVNNGTLNTSGKYFEVSNDIILNKDYYSYRSWGSYSPDNEWTPIGVNSTYNFQGNFNGKGFSILGIYIYKISNTAIGYDKGLFGYIGGEGPVIENLTISGYIHGYSRVGGIVGYGVGTFTNKAYIKNCINNAVVKSAFFISGGITGQGSTYLYILNCENKGSITGGTAGGIIGATYNNKIRSCVNIGIITGTNKLGGIVGQNYDNSDIENCYNIGNVTGTGTDIGGISGYCTSSCDVYNCYNSGTISGTTNVGTLVGYNTSDGSNHIGFSYYIDGTTPIGLNESVAASNISSFALIDQILDTPVTINSVQYNILSEALNAWSILNNTYSNFYYLLWNKQAGVAKLPLLTTENNWISGANGTFTTSDSKTVTIKNGIIVGIV